MSDLKLCGYNVPIEPFKNLLTQGMVNHETFRTIDNIWVEPKDVEYIKNKYYTKNGIEIIKGKSVKMSKSKKNTVNPEEIINQYGADTARLFMMADSPPERDLEWSQSGIRATFKYLKKIFNFLKKSNFIFIPKSSIHNLKANKEALLTNDYIGKITSDIVNHRFNTAVAKIRQLSNELLKINSKNKELFNHCWSIFVRLIYPFTPHFSEEMARPTLKNNVSISKIPWPSEELIDKSNFENVNIVVQLNGKKKLVLNIEKGLGKDQVTEVISKIKPDLMPEFKNTKRVKFIQDKIINFVK